MLYRVLLFVHVMAVIMWLGAGIIFQVLAERATAGNNEGMIRTLVALGDTFGKTYFAPLTVVVLLSGLFMVFNGDLGFDHVFILGGLVGVITSGAIGATIIGPSSERLHEQIGAGEPIDDQALAVVTRMRNVGRFDFALMILVVFLMTYKPGG
jgi:uncharacterized membrane protein